MFNICTIVFNKNCSKIRNIIELILLSIFSKDTYKRHIIYNCIYNNNYIKVSSVIFPFSISGLKHLNKKRKQDKLSTIIKEIVNEIEANEVIFDDEINDYSFLSKHIKNTKIPDYSLLVFLPELIKKFKREYKYFESALIVVEEESLALNICKIIEKDVKYISLYRNNRFKENNFNQFIESGTPICFIDELDFQNNDYDIIITNIMPIKNVNNYYMNHSIIYFDLLNNIIYRKNKRYLKVHACFKNYLFKEVNLKEKTKKKIIDIYVKKYLYNIVGQRGSINSKNIENSSLILKEYKGKQLIQK